MKRIGLLSSLLTLTISALFLSSCKSEELSAFDKKIRFTHFSEPSWTYEAAENYIHETDFSSTPLNIISRTEWGARRARPGLLPIGPVDGIVLHHTLTPDHVTLPSIQNFHMDERGWDDIGYHYVIARDENLEWQIFEGRTRHALGAHAGRFQGRNLNIGKIGISMVGNFGRMSPDNPDGWPPFSGEHERQPEKRVVFLVGQLIHHLTGTLYPNIEFFYTHRTAPHNINLEGGVCPGRGALSIFNAFLEKFNLSDERQALPSFFEEEF